jgi:hypothetical protein
LIIAAAEERCIIEQEDILQASRLLHYIESEMLYTFKWLGMKPIGQDQERIIRTLKAFGGEMEHADILRKLIYFMNAIQFKNSMETLTQSGIVKTDITQSGITYKLIGDV